jgi:hypothetical protein
VRVIPGAQQYATQEESLKGYAQRLAAQAAEAKAREPKLSADLEAARRGLADAVKLRDRARTEEDALWQRYHELAWRIAAQRLLEAELARLENEAAGLRSQLAWWKGYLKRLQAPGPGPNPGPQPGQPDFQFWVWALAMSLLAALISALAHWWLARRRLFPA